MIVPRRLCRWIARPDWAVGICRGGYALVVYVLVVASLFAGCATAAGKPPAAATETARTTTTTTTTPTPGPSTQTACAATNVTGSRFGVDINVFQVGMASLPHLFDEVQTLNTGWVRTGIPWKRIEPQPGQWNFSETDTLVALAQSHHVQLLFSLANTPSWALADPSSASAGHDGPPRDPSVFAAFASRMATRYRGKICAWKIYNEPWNTNKSWVGGTPAQYAAVLAAAYTAIHAAAPEDLVVLGGVNCQTNTPDRQSLENNATWQALLADPTHPIAHNFDVLDIHVAANAASVAQDKVNCSLNALSQYQVTKPVWITEFGYQSDPSVQHLAGLTSGATSQAQYIQSVAPLLLHISGVDKIFWVYLQDNPTAPVATERSIGLLDANGNPKPSFAAYQRVIKQQG